MTRTPRTRAARLLALALVATLAGCATTRMSAEWRDPGFPVGALKGKRVLVVCRAPDDTMRRVCEDQWAAQLGVHAILTTRSYSIPAFPWASGDASPEMKAAVKASGAAALAAMSLNPGDIAMVNPGPQVGVGVGGGSGGGYRGGGFSFGGIGISLPVGGATTTQGLASITSLVDAATGALVWSGNATTPSSPDVQAQVAALAQVTIQAMQKAGVF